jgi:hypothetical protein
MKKTGEHIRVNFGQSPFVFDIDGMMAVSNNILPNFDMRRILRFPFCSPSMDSDPNPRGFRIAQIPQTIQNPSVGDARAAALRALTVSAIRQSEQRAREVREARDRLARYLLETTESDLRESGQEDRIWEARLLLGRFFGPSNGHRRLNTYLARTNTSDRIQDEKKQIRMQIEATR